jgi:hypothetical protein
MDVSIHHHQQNFISLLRLRPPQRNSSSSGFLTSTPTPFSLKTRLSMSNLNKDEYIEVHNMNLDKLERVHRKEFLRSYPYELPCQSLFFALLHYQRIMDHSIKSVYRSELSSMSIKNIEFVHLSNIKNNFDSGCPDDDLISSFQRINSLGSMQMSGF